LIAMRALRTNIHIISGQFAQLAGHGQDANHEEVHLMEGQGALAGERFLERQELIGKIHPVATRGNMMAEMIAIIISALIHRRVGDIVREAVRVLGARRVHKDVLGPIAEHHEQGAEQIRRNEDPESGRGIVAVKVVHGKEIEGGIGGKMAQIRIARAADEIIRKLDPNGAEITKPIGQEMDEIVTLIWSSRGHVVGEDVVLDVVHNHVMEVVHPRRQPEIWPKNITGIEIERMIFPKEFAMRGKMKGQYKSLKVKTKMERQVNRAEPPGDMTKVKEEESHWDRSKSRVPHHSKKRKVSLVGKLLQQPIFNDRRKCE